MNFPSITVTIERAVMNVGTPGTYHVQISEPQGISASTKPDTLEFKNVGEGRSSRLRRQRRVKVQLMELLFLGNLYGQMENIL